jgi:ABC-2 type transport system permease protein
VSRPAPFASAVLAQARMEVRLTARRSENLLAMIGIPAAALVFFGTVGVGGAARGVASLLPASLALALVASGLVNLGIATAFERGYGVLKRLGSAPLGRDGLLVAKVAVVSIIGAAQVAALLLLAALLGSPPADTTSWPAIAMVTVVSVGTFASIGLLLAGTVRAEGVLLIANVAFLVAILFGGSVVALGDLPGPLAALALVLPWGAAAEAFRAALAGGDVVGPLAVVAAWGLAAAVAAIRTFRWE